MKMNSWTLVGLCVLFASVVAGGKARKRNVWGTRGYRFNEQHGASLTTGQSQCPIICRGQSGIPGIPGLDGEDGLPGLPGNPGQKGEPGRPAESFLTKDGTVEVVKGQKGEQGSPGPEGPVRVTEGAKGDKGEQGPRGDKGEPGEAAESLSVSKAMVFATSHDMMKSFNLEEGTLLYVLETQTLWIQTTSGFTRLAAATQDRNRNTIDNLPTRG